MIQRVDLAAFPDARCTDRTQRTRAGGSLALAAVALIAAGCGGRLIGLQPKAAPVASGTAPAFTLPANDGTKVTVDGKHDTALVFYRGFW